MTHLFFRRALPLVLCLCLLTGCAPRQPQQYSATYLDLFDTVTTVTGRAESEAAFQAQAQAIHDALLEYHRLFDIYHTYPGLNNLKTVNDQAGIAPVPVDPRITQLLLDCRDYHSLSGGLLNPALGSVLELWHTARTQSLDDPDHACLPDSQALAQAADHTDMDRVEIDPEASTVFLPDGEMSLDVGAVAKGWALQRVCESAPEGLLINAGGNICATGPKDGETPWVIGIQDPAGGGYLHTLALTRGSVVTSGDYQRTYQVDGVSYHHIIHPETGYPAELWRSVTVVCPDSGLADALSTTLFLLPLEAGLALLETVDAQAMWVAGDGGEYFSPGFEAMLRS